MVTPFLLPRASGSVGQSGVPNMSAEEEEFAETQIDEWVQMGAQLVSQHCVPPRDRSTVTMCIT
jgi:hypothetical protein